MVANVDHKVEWMACVVKAVKASFLYVTARMSKLRQISNLLLKQRREFVIAADWNMVPEQLETTGLLVIGWELCGRASR